MRTVIDKEKRAETYNEMLRLYLGEELIQNVYEREKLLNQEFAQKDEKIHLQMKDVELKEMIHDNEKILCLAMYKQGVRDIIDIMKGV